MKNYLIIMGLLFTAPVFGQASAQQLLASVENPHDADIFAMHHSQLQPDILSLTSGYDTAALHQQLFKMKKGDVVTNKDRSYKILEDTTEYAFQASYIYLDGSRLSQAAIDSIRTLILKRYKAGVSFETLADKYTMDHNPDHGALHPFAAVMMVKEFETGVRQHVKGDIFTIDVPGNQWYYVVKKTADDKVTRTITVLSIITPH